MSHGTVLKRFLALRLEIKIFMKEKGKFVAERSDEVALGFGIAMRYEPTRK
jgi:hypothetical protein